MKKRKINFSILLFSIVFNIICNANEKVENLPAKPADIYSLTQAQNKFGFKMLKQLHIKGENVFISPTSINTAFGMLHNGTVGAVKQEFENVFGWGNFNNRSFNSANQALINSLISKEEKSILEIANSIWVRQKSPVEKDFVENNMKFFKAEVNNVPFNKQTVDRINGWAAEKTHGKIKEVIKKLSPDELMLLVNAVYFKGTWTKSFDKKNTYTQNFTLADNSKVKVPLMYQKETVEYMDNEDFQAVRLPFGKGDTAMTFILPKKGLANFQETLTEANFQNWQKRLSKRQVKLFVPKFKVEYATLLNDVLKKIGMTKAFELSRGFAKINPHLDLKISRVIHKTFLEVKEEGAEAVAVSAIGIIKVSVDRTPVMRIDRPFLCAITNTKTGNIMFIGNIYNPLQK